MGARYLVLSLGVRIKLEFDLHLILVCSYDVDTYRERINNRFDVSVWLCTQSDFFGGGFHDCFLLLASCQHLSPFMYLDWKIGISPRRC
jgi:hypothetical protein